MNKKVLLMGAALSGMIWAAGCSSTSKSAHDNEQAAIDGEGHGINSCKGTGECGGKGHSCAGKNSCKGKGWKKMSKTDCLAQGGDFKA